MEENLRKIDILHRKRKEGTDNNIYTAANPWSWTQEHITRCCCECPIDINIQKKY